MGRRNEDHINNRIINLLSYDQQSWQELVPYPRTKAATWKEPAEETPARPEMMPRHEPSGPADRCRCGPLASLGRRRRQPCCRP